MLPGFDLPIQSGMIIGIKLGNRLRIIIIHYLTLSFPFLDFKDYYGRWEWQFPIFYIIITIVEAGSNNLYDHKLF